MQAEGCRTGQVKSRAHPTMQHAPDCDCRRHHRPPATTTTHTQPHARITLPNPATSNNTHAHNPPVPCRPTLCLPLPPPPQPPHHHHQSHNNREPHAHPHPNPHSNGHSSLSPRSTPILFRPTQLPWAPGCVWQLVAAREDPARFWHHLDLGAVPALRVCTRHLQAHGALCAADSAGRRARASCVRVSRWNTDGHSVCMHAGRRFDNRPALQRWHTCQRTAAELLHASQADELMHTSIKPTPPCTAAHTSSCMNAPRQQTRQVRWWCWWGAGAGGGPLQNAPHQQREGT